MNLIDCQSKLPFLHGGPVIEASFKSKSEDFIVSEHLDFELTGYGEHVWLYIEKENLTTRDIVKRLRKLSNRRAVDIGYAGLKDKHGQTAQWFSVCLANQPEPDWHSLESDAIRIHTIKRHDRKLKTGALKENAFKVVLRDCRGDVEKAIDILQKLSQSGMPNYFGPQRFGFDGQNIKAGHDLLMLQTTEKEHFKRGIYLSAIRSAVFNQVLAERLAADCWAKCLKGDKLSLAGSQSFFIPDKIDDDIQTRLDTFDIHITGPLIGLRKEGSDELCSEFEEQLVSMYQCYEPGFKEFNLESARRPLRAPVNKLNVNYSDNSLELSFTLPVGSFATSLIREISINKE